jgi:hypothetical protein
VPDSSATGPSFEKQFRFAPPKMDELIKKLEQQMMQMKEQRQKYFQK